MTKILPTEGESAEIGQRAVAAFHAQKPDGWRPSDLSGDADAGYDSFVQVVAHAQYMEAFHAQFKGSTVSAYSADKSFVRVVPTARYVLLPLANLLTGYSVKAMERKIERGDWQEGKVWRRAPDGHRDRRSGVPAMGGESVRCYAETCGANLPRSFRRGGSGATISLTECTSCGTLYLTRFKPNVG